MKIRIKNKTYTLNIRNIGIVIGVIAVIALAVSFMLRSPFKESYTLEAGQPLEIIDLLEDDADASFVSEINDELLKTVGEHDLKVKAKGMTYKVKLIVVDTVAPTATKVELDQFIDGQITPESFVKDVKDVTDVTITYAKQYDFSKEGKQNIEVLLTDAGGNVTKIKTTVNLTLDDEAPVIEAPVNITVKKGDTVSYRSQIKVTDNRDGVMTNFKIDSSQVNLDKVGNYQVFIEAVDALGNTSKKTIKVRVVSYTVSDVVAEADSYAYSIIDNIITAGMSKKDKLDAIYNYVKENYKYVAKHEGTIDDYYKDALTGFKTGKGDCYVVNAMARYLLERVGIKTYGVDLAGSDMRHISFMVNVGDGWYHYCAFRKKSGIVIYKWTDAQMVTHYSYAGITEMPSNVPDTPKE